MKNKIGYLKEYHPNTWSDARKLLCNIATEHKEVYFRGQSNSIWPLKSSFQRIMDDLLKNNMILESQNTKDICNVLEQELLKQFERASVKIPCSPDLPRRDEQEYMNNEYVAICQHYSLPTRLLDWTTSPYIASFFAFDGHRTSILPIDNKVAVWAFDWKMFELFLYCNYKDIKPPEDLVPPGELLATIQLCRRSNHSRIDIVKITGNKNRRIIYQQGIFTMAIKVEDDFELYLRNRQEYVPGVILHKLIIPGNQQAEVLRDLSLMSITPVVLMNDLDGAAATAFNEAIRYHRIIDSSIVM